MIETHEIAVMMKAVARVTREVVAAAIATINTRVDELRSEMDARIKAIPSGPQGQPGRDGIDGKDGQPGMDGAHGKDGAIGPAGRDGVDGKDGKDGDPGASIKGDPGERGEKGERGEIGPAGPAGERGEKGEPGMSITGPAGEKGIDGKDGRDGRDGIAKDGKDGRDGLDGKDALQIDILPAVDPTKSYPRGTFARCKGGLIRAVRNTDPLPESLQDGGWEVVLDGIKAMVVTQGDDVRTFAIEIGMTSGQKSEFAFSLPVLIYREIWKDGIEYERGDVVTWGNSAYHCQTKTSGKPGVSPDWKLMVRKGGDGKDGIGIQGPEGKPGKDGRDSTQINRDGAKH